ncbi:DUF5683 domain-containing protein [Rufibacter sp. LB8]|uniref:DUF5683 domain-containing protein n=1 Tax=Rufibacter sp. LB8 TaxID=2777781 RepID=UPI00178C32EE|nr:DUF5683 domain-containing protein [Rufibacter sp. LB8]
MVRPANAQVVTAGPDSVVVSTPPVVENDTTKLPPPKHVKEAISRWSKPAQAAVYSLMLPGLGQAYNKSYWKIPLIYVTGGVIGYFIYDNNRKYQGFARAIRIRTDGDASTVDAYAFDPIYGIDITGEQGTRNLYRSRDFFRKYRDLDIILGVIAWGLNVMEAHVHAHLKGFDISDDLSLRIQPNLQPMANQQYAAGFSMQFNLRR